MSFVYSVENIYEGGNKLFNDKHIAEDFAIFVKKQIHKKYCNANTIKDHSLENCKLANKSVFIKKEKIN